MSETLNLRAESLGLQTEHAGLILREPRTFTDDLAQLDAIDENRSHLSQFGNTTAKKFKTIEDIRQFRFNTDEIQMGIWENGSGFLGVVSAMPHANNTETEIAFWLRSSVEGKGYATFAIKAMSEFLKPLYSRVFAEVHRDNHKSAAVLKRANYQQVKEVERDWGSAIVFELQI